MAGFFLSLCLSRSLCSYPYAHLCHTLLREELLSGPWRLHGLMAFSEKGQEVRAIPSVSWVTLPSLPFVSKLHLKWHQIYHSVISSARGLQGWTLHQLSAGSWRVLTHWPH